MFANNTSFAAENNAFLSKVLGDNSLRYNQKLPVEYLKHWKESRGLLLYQTMGSGKTRIGSAIMDNFQQEGYKVLFISSKSLHENAKTEQKKYLEDIKRENIDELVKKHYKFISLNASNMIQQVYKAVRHEGEELFSQVIEKMFKPKNDKSGKPKKSKKASLHGDIEDIGDIEDEDDTNKDIIKNIKKHMEKVNSLINLDNCVVVIDEAHDFFNSVVNGSKNASALYYLLLFSNNSKIIFMSGSPIVNDPFEITVPINILGGVVDGQTIFGENYETFYKYFVTNPEINLAESDDSAPRGQPVLKNRDKFMDRISGMVSYFGADSPEFLKLLPTPEALIVRKIPMSDTQFSSYVSARDKEIESTLSSFKGRALHVPTTKPKGAGSTYRVMSRQISNVLYPKNATTLVKNAYGNVITGKHLELLDESFFSVAGLETYAPKILHLLIDLAHCLPEGQLADFLKAVKKHNPALIKSREMSDAARGPAIVYSQFVESGVGVIARALEHWGFENYGSVKRSPKPSSPGLVKPSYAMMMGEIDFEERKKYEDVINSDPNPPISVLLVTVTAAQGINLFTVTNEFMLEPYWHLSRHEQFFARAVRPHSLEFLPSNKRKVGRYLYLADYPADFKKSASKDIDTAKIKTIMETEKTTDLTLYAKAILRKVLNNSVLSAVKAAAIDCDALYASSKNSQKHSCRVCRPTGRPLFTRNLFVDMKNPSPCVPTISSELKATKIEVDGKKFAYTKDPLKIFKFNESTEKYQEINTGDTDYYDVYEFIGKIPKK